MVEGQEITQEGEGEGGNGATSRVNNDSVHQAATTQCIPLDSHMGLDCDATRVAGPNGNDG